MVQYRKDSLVNGQVYHVFTKSIAGYKIFNNSEEYSRFISTVRYYQKEKPLAKFCKYVELAELRKNKTFFLKSESDEIVGIIAYCVMPTHVHFILKQLKDSGISTFMSHTLNSYTRFFNIKHKRKGPLWQGRFKSVLVSSEEQLLHLTRYVHLNPVTSYLVDDPENWLSSSYLEYVNKNNGNDGLCDFDDLLEIEPASYNKFVKQRAGYQRDLQLIKDLILE